MARALPVLLGPTLIGLTVLLGGCGDNDNAPGPGGVSVGEARALDEAAQMIEDQPSIPDEDDADIDSTGGDAPDDDQPGDDAE